MKTKDELFQKVRLTPRVLRVVKSNSQIGLQDHREQDARTSYDQPSGSKMPSETGSNTVDYRIPGVPLSAVEQQDTHRKAKVKKLIEKFENHPNKESFLQDFMQTKEINKFSQESQDLIADMNNTEIFELCETSSKQQCPDCNLYWEAGIVCCTCGRCSRISRSEKEVDKSNDNVVSIPGCVFKKNNKRSARHGPSERQRMFFKAKEMLHKAGQKKHGSHSSIIARWLNDYKYRNSLSDIGWNEQDIMLFDRIALKNYSFVATRAERIRNSEHWILKLNQDGAQQPLNQRPYFAQAKRECKRSHDENVARTQAGKKNRSSKPTRKTKERTTVRRNWRIRLYSRSSNRVEVLLPSAVKPVAFVAIVVVHKLGTQQLDDKKLEFLAFFTVSPFLKNIFRVRTSFGWPGVKLPDNRRGVWTEHPLAQHVCARTGHAHIARTDVWLTHHANTRGSSAQRRVACIGASEKVVGIHAQCPTCCRTCHRTLLHDLSHLPQLSSDHFLPHCPVLLQLLRDWIKIPCEIHDGVADTLNLHLPQVMSPSWSNLTITSFTELNWTEILGQIRIKYQKEFWEMSIKILSHNIRRKLENLVSTCPASNQGYTRITIQVKALQIRILKIENHEKCWSHRCMYRSEEKIMVLLTNPQLQGNQKQK